MAYAHINAVMAGAHNVEDQGMACCMPSWLTDGYPYSSWSRRKGHTYKYSRAEARGFLQKRIAAVVPRWISSADVRAIIPINEAIANQPYTGRGGWPHTWITGAQENIFSWAFGDSTHNSTEWFGQTFKWVRAAADGAGATKLKLLYNDYGIITPGAKQDAVLRLLTEQKAAGVPIDGIGFQSHLPCDCTGAAGCNSSAVIAASMRRFIKAGFTVAVTELDVSTDGMDPESLCTPAMQAAVYGAVLEACLSVSPHCESVMVWGFTDHIYSPGQWLAGKQPAIFDGDFHAKESYFAMQKILAAKTPGPRPPPPPPSAGKKYACVVAGPGEDVCMEAGPGTVGVPLAQCKATCKVAAKTNDTRLEPIAAPAVPLVVNSPYLQVWSPRGNLTEHDTVSGDAWGEGTPKELGGLIRVDGRTERFLGARGAVNAAVQTDLMIFPTRTVYTFSVAKEKVQLILTWTTAVLPQNLTLMSRPVTYVTFAVSSLDGKAHDIAVYFDAAGQLVTLPLASSCPGPASPSCRRNRPQPVDFLVQQGLGKMWMRGSSPISCSSRFVNTSDECPDNSDWGQLYLATDTSAQVTAGPAEALRAAFAAGSRLPVPATPPILAADLPAVAAVFNLSATHVRSNGQNRGRRSVPNQRSATSVS